MLKTPWQNMMQRIAPEGSLRAIFAESIKPKSVLGRAIFWSVLGIATLAGSIWWQWDHVKGLPGVSEFIESVARHPIPHAPQDRLTIAVAHLENDINKENERLLLAQLESFRGIAVLPLDRTLTLPSGGSQEENIAKGHEGARALLAKSGAGALIWGSVLTHDGHTHSNFVGRFRTVSSLVQRWESTSRAPI